MHSSEFFCFIWVRFVQDQDLGQNIYHSHVIKTLIIVESDIGKAFWPSVLSSMLIVPRAPCLSEHVYQLNADFPPVFAFPALILIPAPQTHWSHLQKSLETSHHLTIFKWFDHMALLSKQLPHFLQNMIELLVSRRQVHWFYWHYTIGLRVHKSKRLAPALFPLGTEKEWTSEKLHAFVIPS